MHKTITVRMAPPSSVGWMTLFSSTMNAPRWTGEASSTLGTEASR